MSEYPAILSLSSIDGVNGFRMSGSAIGDRAGYSVAAAGDVNGDGFADIIVGAPGSQTGGYYSGGAYVIFGGAAPAGGNLNLAALDGNNGFALQGYAYDTAGRSVSSAGDINGDGFDDLIVGAPGATPDGHSYAGEAYVIFGGAAAHAAPLDLASLDGNNGFAIAGAATLDNAGFSVAAAGDVNGDGVGDVIIGAFGADSHGSVAGAAYVVFGKTMAFDADFNVADLDGSNGFAIFGAAAGDRAGWSVAAAGDLNRDGFSDVVIGAPGHGGGGGQAYVVYGSGTGIAPSVDVSALDGHNGFTIVGVAGSDAAVSVSAAGDINGDGRPDLLIGADETPGGGAAYVLFGPAHGFAGTVRLATLPATRGFKIATGTANDFTGHSVSAAGDLNGDGFDDLVVGAYGANAPHHDSGAAYVVFGSAAPFGQDFDLTALDGNNGFMIAGNAAGDAAGISVSAAGDVNGDGLADLIVGAHLADAGAADSGAAYVIYGALPNGAVTREGSAGSNTIHGGNFDDTLRGVAGNDILYGHDGADVLAGGRGNDTLTGGLGADTLLGGNQSDTFVFHAVAESTGVAHDIVDGFNPNVDRFDLDVSVSGVDRMVRHGALSGASFDSDLSAAVDDARLAASHAVLFTASTGDLAGHRYLIVDANGQAGYQAGTDYVFEIEHGHQLGALSIATFI